MKSPKRILLVDDDEDYASLVRMRLEKEGYQAEWVSGCNDAVKVLEKDFGFYLIILDIQMPDKNGLASLVYLRSHFAMRAGGFAIPVMIATGLHSSRLRDLFTAEGVCDYIQKPFESQV